MPNNSANGDVDTAYIPPPTGMDLWSDVNGHPTWGENGGRFDENGLPIRGTRGFEKDAARYRSLGEVAAAREAPQLDYSRANATQNMARTAFDSAGGDVHMGTGVDRNEQIDALALQRGAAQGTAPSQAQLLGRTMLDQSLQNQLAGAASARGGPAVQAAAGRQASIAAAGQQQQSLGQLAALRANEMATARDAYAGTAGTVRGQDYQGAATNIQRGGAYTTLGGQQAQQTLTQGGLDMQQRAMNDNARQFYEGKRFDVQTAQLSTDLQNQAMDQGNHQFQVGLDMKRDEIDRNNENAGMAAMGTMAGGMFSRAGGGPVKKGTPYLVGERGPELIVPAKDGTVIPNHELGRVALMGGREDPYGPPMGGRETPYPERLYGGREDPYAVPGREGGGPVKSGKPYVVGEAGPEAVVPVDLGEVEDWNVPENKTTTPYRSAGDVENWELEKPAGAEQSEPKKGIKHTLGSLVHRYAEYSSPERVEARDEQFARAHPTLDAAARSYRGQEPRAPEPTPSEAQSRHLQEQIDILKRAEQMQQIADMRRRLGAQALARPAQPVAMVYGPPAPPPRPTMADVALMGPR